MAKRSKKRGCLANLVLLSVTVLVTLLLGEFVVRIFMPSPVDPWENKRFIEYDENLGWRKIAGLEAVNKQDEYEITIKVNERGLRGKVVPYERQAGKKRVLFLGDSFTEGFSVNEEDLFITILADSLGNNWELINGGTNGYSTDQQLLFFEETGKNYQPDFTILMFCDNDPYYNTSQRFWPVNKPYFKLHDDSLVRMNDPVPPPSEEATDTTGWWLKTRIWLHYNSQLYRMAKETVKGWLPKDTAVSVPLTYTDAPYHDFFSVIWPKQPSDEMKQSWKMTAALLQALKRSVAANGSELIVFYIPESNAVYPGRWQDTRERFHLNDEEYDPAQGGKMLQRVCREAGIRIVEPTKQFLGRTAQHPDDNRSLYYHEGHWTPAGNRMAAELLLFHLRQESPDELLE